MANTTLLNTSQKILIVTEKIPDLSALLCSNALLSILPRIEKVVNWFIDESKLPSAYINLLPADKSPLLNTFNSKDFYAIVNKTSGVEDIEISKTESYFNLIFRTKDGELGISDISLKPLQFEYDLLIFLTNEATSKIIEQPEVKDFMFNTENLFVQNNNNSALGFELINILLKNQINLEPQEATSLLAALMWETMNKNNLEYYSVANRLIFKYKANFEEALSMINFTLSADINGWRREVFKNLNLNNEINYSIVTSENIKANELINIPNEYKLPLLASTHEENHLVITELENSTIVFARGEIVSKLMELNAHYTTINSGLLMVVTSLETYEILEAVNLKLDKKAENQTEEVPRKEITVKLDDIKLIPESREEDREEEKVQTEEIVEKAPEVEKEVEVKLEIDPKTQLGLNSLKKNPKNEPKSEIKKSDVKSDDKQPTKTNPKPAEKLEKITENRNTSVLSKQTPRKLKEVPVVQTQNKSNNTAPRTVPRAVSDPLPPANW